MIPQPQNPHMFLKGIHNREFWQTKFIPLTKYQGKEVKEKEKKNLKQHKCSKCLRVASGSHGARSVSLFVP